MKQLMYILKNTLAALIFLSGISAYSQTLSLFNQMNVPANPTNTYFGNICALTLDVDPATGNQIYVWSEKQTSSTDRDIYCAIYDRNSVLLIPRFKVNNGTGGDNYYQRIKIHPYDGTFIITWAGKKSGNWDIYMKSISLALNTVSSQLIMNAPDLLVNGITAGDQLTPIPTFHLGSGELLIGYTHTVAAGDRDIYYRRVNYSTMAVLGTDQSISNVTTNDQALSAMEYSSYTGEVIMFYSSTKPASTGFDCYKRILLYTAGAYSFSGTETRVNTYMTSDQTASTICINQTNGQYALSWVSLGQSSARGVYAKVFDALHTEIKAEFRISVLAADNIMNAKGIWKESTNTLVYFWTYYGSTNAIRYTQFDGNAAFAMIGGDNDALGTTNAVQGGYYTTYVPAYDAVRDVVYLSYDMYPSIGTLSSYGKVNIYRNIFDPAVSTTSNTDMNWVDVKAYDANGNVVSEGRIFYDNFGKESQSQSFNAENPTTVFASMPLYDYLDRSAIQTLPGVTNTTGALTFDPAFVKYSAGANYNPQNWDGASTTNNPDPVLTSAGLGYYYGTSNTLEAGVPNTSYPYSRTFFNDNAPGGVVKQGGLGEALRMGQNHESKSISLVVLNELDHYAKVRRGNFVVNLNAPGTLSQKATKHFVIDQNGMNGIVFTDAAGNTIATAKDGASTADPALTSTIALKPNMYYCNFPYYVSGTGWNMKYLQVFGQGNVEIINVADGTILYAMGPAVNVPEITYAGPMTTIQVRSTEPFRVKMLCTSNLPNPAPDYWARYESTYQQGQNSIDLHLQTGHALAATISNAPGATISIQDLTTGNMVYTGAASGYSYSTLAKGFYRLRFTGMNYDQDYSTNSITFSFKQSYTDWAYYFYDDAGRLIAKTAPSGITSMTNYSSPPFTGTYTYSTIGQVLSSTEVDGGTTNYVYRNDGLLRFTQNADQATDGRFSFVNYDADGRTIMSGEYKNGLNSAPLSFKTQKQYDASPVANTVIGILNNSQSTNYGGLTSLNYLVDYNLIEYSTTTVYNILNASGGTIATRQRRNVWNQAALTLNKAGYTTAYSYDNEGRLEWMAQTLPTLGSKTMDYVYDENNRLLQSIYQKNDASDRFIHIYTYDKIGRLKTTSTRESNGLVKLHEKNSYYLHGPLKRRELGESLQGVDYVYTIQGWLKGINHPEMNTAKDPGKDAMAGTPNAGFTADVFGMSLDYFDGDYSNGTVAYATPGDMHSSNYGLIGLDGVTQSNMYNGTIRSVLWQTSEKLNTGNYPNQMSFNYDSKYQLKTGFYGVQDLTTSKFVRTNPDTYLTGVSYDLNGNIIGKLTYKTAGTESLFYNYVANTNKLASVQLVSAAFRTYLYNAIGQMTQQTDADGKVKKLKYNTAGQVIEIKNGNDVVKVTYEYNERGQKVKKLTYSGGVLTNTTWYVLDASGNIVSLYDTKSGSQQQAEIPVYSSARIGVVYKNGSALTFTYELKDHLGNVRATINRIRKSPGKADVVSWADYFPFGEVIPDRHFETAGLLSRFGYQGDYCEAEMDETGWNDFDLRMYDPVIGRWLSRDPYNQYHSPYVGMGNDPMNGVDPDGGYKTRFGAWTAGLVSGIKNFKVDYEEGRGYYYQRNDVTENYGGTFDPELGWVYGDIEVYPRYFESDNHSVIGFFDKHANYVMGIGPILALKALQALKNSHGTTYTNNSGLSLPTPVGNYKGYTSSTTGSTNLFQTNVTTFNGIYDNTEHTLNLRIVTVGTNSDGAILASVNAGFIAVQVEAGLPGVTLDVNTTNIWGETRGTEITIDPKSVGGAAALLRGRRPSYAP